MMKLCVRCQLHKHRQAYTENAYASAGAAGICKFCVSIKNKLYAAANAERIAIKKKARRLSQCPEKLKADRAQNYIDNREQILNTVKKYHAANAEKRRAYQRDYYSKNKEAAKTYNLSYVKERYANDRLFALSMNMRGRLNHVLAGTGWVKSRANEDVFGCTYEDLVLYLESKFLEGMSWANRSEWHIDHKIPLASARTDDELFKLCHFSNLQLLWAMDNLRKGAKMPIRNEVN